MNISPSWRLAGVLASLLLAGCGRGMGDLESWVAEIKARKTTKIEPIPQMKQFDTFVYQPAGRRDPFAAAKVTAEYEPRADNGLRPDTNRNREPLEEFPLDGLQMQGTIRSGQTTYALVKAPDGVLHRVRVGNHLGQNYGRITAISESEVQLSEIVPDGFGGWTQRPATLALTE
jgi:type IV pilus assembly protein PilP